MTSLRRLGLVGLGLCGCSGFDADFGGVTWVGEHFVYRARGDESRVCPAVLQSLERSAAAVAEYFQVELGRHNRFVYYKYRDYAEFRASGACSADADACTDGTRIYTYKPLDGHELVHVIAGVDTGIDMSPLIGEGTAEGFSCSQVNTTRDIAWNWRRFGRNPDVESSVDNAFAGRLMLALANAAGPRSLIELAKLIDEHQTANSTYRSVLDAYGVDLDELGAAAARDYGQFCQPIDVCAGDLLESGKTELGPSCAGPTRWRTPVRPGKFGRFHFEGGQVRLLTCGAAPNPFDLSHPGFYDSDELVDYLLPLDRSYALWIAGASEGVDAHTNVEFYEATTALGHACSLEATYDLTLGRKTILVVDGQEPQLFFPVSTDRPRTVTVYVEPLDLPTGAASRAQPVVRFCADCTGPCQTIDLPANVTRDVLVEGRGVFMMESAEPTNPPRRIVLRPKYREDE